MIGILLCVLVSVIDVAGVGWHLDNVVLALNWPCLEVFRVASYPELEAAIAGANGRVLSLSLAAADYPGLRGAVAEAQSRGALVVAAAGNGAPATAYPAAYPGVLAVGPSDGPSSPADLYAPGFFSSYAAPKAARCAAELLEARPKLLGQQLRDLLISTSREGVLDCSRALARLVGYRAFVPVVRR